jgi:hypothetical protein
LHEKQSNIIENYKEMVVAQLAEISPTVEQQVLESSWDADVESLFAIGDDVVGLSLMSHEVTRGGTIAISTGQRCNIFQSECKIKEKVCKLIIDGGSFTNAISADVVYVLPLSTWRLPTLLYM